MSREASILPVKTRIITASDDMSEVVLQYMKGKLKKGDIVIISESVLAITQDRAILAEDVEPGPMANLLVKFVHKTPTGVGIGSPISMQVCLDAVGRTRVLASAGVSAVGKAVGRRGWFYKAAGMQAALIDAEEGTMAPFDKHIVLGPLKPRKFARELSEKLGEGIGVAVVDVNDLKCAWVIGASKGVDKEWVEELLIDNPLGQTDEQTPIGIIRPKK